MWRMAEIVRPFMPADEMPRDGREPCGGGRWRMPAAPAQRAREILVETARRAGVSPQYLSEMERGVKEPSSEMIAAVAGALDVTLGDLTLAVATSLLRAPSRVAPAGPTAYALAA